MLAITKYSFFSAVIVIVVAGCTRMSDEGTDQKPRLAKANAQKRIQPAQPSVAKTSAKQTSAVTRLRVPGGGIQPRAVVDAKGTLHLIYFKGQANAGDLFYVHKAAGQGKFSAPLRVNSQPGSAVATGTVRGGQIALGKGGRIHVAWNGSGNVTTKGRSAMLYTRLNDAGTAFEPQRNLMTRTTTLDGGGTVAADAMGHVYVAWHGLKTGSERGEDQRQVWVARSTDEGKSFSKEMPAWGEPTGVCGCCSMQAMAGSKGGLALLYRSANASVNRDIYVLASNDKGKSFRGALLHRWKVPG